MRAGSEAEAEARAESEAEVRAGSEAEAPIRPDRFGRRRAKALLSGSREVLRTVYRDPEHIAERLTLLSTQRIGPPSLEWAQEVLARPDVDVARVAAERRKLAERVARIDGAVAGTPFFVALIPGYIDYLWQEAAMLMRVAALYGRDPRTLQVAAELMVLRGVHPSVETARAALEHVQATPMPGKPTRRRGLRTWVRSVRMLLVLGGFLSAPKQSSRPVWERKLLAFGGLAIAVGIWVITWVFPVTFMIAMAWGCETNARDLGRRTQLHYAGEASSTRVAIREAKRAAGESDDWRDFLRGAAMFLSVLVPIAFVGYADHVRARTGITPIAAIGALVALSMVVATAVLARRR